MAKERRENGAGTKPKQLANGKWWKKISYTDNYGNLNDALNMAVVDGYITKNPLVKIALPTPEAKKIKPLVKDEIVKLLKAAEGSPFYTIIYLAIHTGARKGELAALTWDDIDFKAKKIHIQHSVKYDRANKKFIIGSTKTDGCRSIPIHATVIAELKKHKAKQAAEQLELGNAYEKNNLVFAKPTGEILSLTVLASKFNAIVKESGIERRTFHDLRYPNFNKIQTF